MIARNAYFRGMGTRILIAALVALALLSLWAGIAGWNLETDVQMSAHGYIAMAIGIVASLAVGIGLMTLVFYSSRKGYDDAAGQSSARPPKETKRVV
jgi:hypothetical protein